MCNCPDKACPFCEYAYILEGRIPVWKVTYISGDVFYACKKDDDEEKGSL